MKTAEQITNELKVLHLFEPFKLHTTEFDALANIIFDDEQILHIFLSNFAYMNYGNIIAKIEKSEFNCFTVCTDSRLIFIQCSSLSKIKSEIISLKNIVSFECKTDDTVILKIGERNLQIQIRKKEYVQNFITILNSITSGRNITVDELINSNDTHKNASEKQKRQEEEIEKFFKMAGQAIRHKNFKWWIISLTTVIILFSVINRDETKDTPSTQQTYIPNPYDAYKTPSSESPTDTTNNTATEEPIKPKSNTCKSQVQMQKELKRISEEVIYNMCYNNFYIKVSKSKVSKDLKPSQKEIDAVNMGYKECKDAGKDASTCCQEILDGYKNFIEQKTNSAASDNRENIKSACETFV